ncbi:AAA family ATPase [Colletotrichum karsti]|uniref:AAA family ATPase n=1 Tax=Colletotrichum karsti TaxID=1095194 RepID=A0A9P6LPV8_9PEZI|nr:AAA family ATPase [Colletotrichum karsti]KAF9881415.1 AAA family ATPase [Colletotrichum karsti]
MDTIDAATDRQTGTDEVNAGKPPADDSASPPKPESDSNPTTTKKKIAKKAKKLPKNKTHKPKKSKLVDDSDTATDDEDSSDAELSSSSDADSSDDSASADNVKRKSNKSKIADLKKSKKTSAASSSKKTKKLGKRADKASSSDSSDTDSASSDDVDDGLTNVRLTPQQIQVLQQHLQRGTDPLSSFGGNPALGVQPFHDIPPPRRAAARMPMGLIDAGNPFAPNHLKHLPAPNKRGKLDYKRVDQVWDNTIHNYKLQDTTETTSDSQYDGYVLQVRRTFDWEGKYKTTFVDIKSKILRECLQDVIGNVKGVSLVDEVPKLDPNLLFLYLEDLRSYAKKLKKKKPISTDKKERKKEQKSINNKRLHLKVLLKYLDKDYAHVKKSLYPMLENGLITFELLWALWKPDTLVYTATYGTQNEPRVFKVEQAERHSSMVKGEFYWLDGKYFEFDGKQFGYGTFAEEIPEFRGARKITSLNAYPLSYHKDKDALVASLIERGKKFVKLGGVHYQSHEGLAYYKKKKAIVKVNINGRIMVDPAVHRRINPNYQVSAVRPKDHDILSDDSNDESDSDEKEGCDSDEGGCEKMVTKVVHDRKGKAHLIRVPKSDLEEPAASEQPLARLDDSSKNETEGVDDPAKANKTDVPEFSDEEYLIASPIVLGFSFSEKLWLEFTVSGVKEIHWNETAYDSLVLQPKQKDIVKALVESHKYHATESIDDVIQGKGKGLVAVLHGPPGTGKTLTAEGISELLKCPLYMASAGELGTDPRYLEQELQKILDICHAWGAILLLDEADVFLEKRNLHEINRNALVSIFLRQLEYFQGILFLTTNRVETFDDAFQSRIHIALRYESLTVKAKKAIFRIFVERVRELEKVDLKPFSEQDYADLARYDLNGRQIKNTIRTAQALAVNKGVPLSMEHIRQVLDVQNSFDIHLKGGEGYQDAMRSYT